MIREVGLKSAMVVPMRIGDVTLGAISLVTAESGRRYDEDDLLFAQDLALRAATAVQNARLFEEQQRVAPSAVTSTTSCPSTTGTWSCSATSPARASRPPP